MMTYYVVGFLIILFSPILAYILVSIILFRKFMNQTEKGKNKTNKRRYTQIIKYLIYGFQDFIRMNPRQINTKIKSETTEIYESGYKRSLERAFYIIINKEFNDNIPNSISESNHPANSSTVVKDDSTKRELYQFAFSI
jgi:hypothetical protein